MTTVSDDFNRANGALGANWTNFSGRSGFLVISNQCGMGWGNGASGSYYSGATFDGGDIFSQATVKGLISSGYVGLAVRHTSSQAYLLTWTNTYLRLTKWVAGAFTSLASDLAAPSVNDVLYLEAVGTSITAKKNGVIVFGPITDSDLSSGPPGVFGNDSGSGAAMLDDWSGGDVAAGGAQASMRQPRGSTGGMQSLDGGMRN